MKLRVGQNIQADAIRVTHIRRAFGDKLDIAVDAATRYNRTDSRRHFRAAATGLKIVRLKGQDGWECYPGA